MPPRTMEVNRAGLREGVREPRTHPDLIFDGCEIPN